MEYTSSSAEKGINCGPSPREQLDPMVTSDGGLRNLMSEELLNTFSEPMNLDWYAGWCSSPSSVEQMLSTYGLLGFQSIIPCPSLDTLSFAEQNSSTFPDGTSGKSGYEDRGSLPHMNGRFNLPLDNKDDLTAKHCYGSPQSKLPDAASSIVSRPVSMSLDEKMLKALSLLKGPAAAGILAQVWVPIKHGDQYMLSTSEQPYLLDQSLAGYREVSRTFAFSAERKAGLSLGLPGRVFVSKIPEWTSNVIYYKNAEYLRVDHAINHAVRGSAALPIFDPFNMSCCAVLELVTVKEKADFDSEMDNVCHALKAVNLRSTGPPRLLPQGLSRNQKLALADIADVLRVVCHAHRLPLALTWIPCEYTEEAGDDIINVRVREGNLSLTGKCILCIEGTACYINDKEMQGFVHACMEHHIMEGQGIAGKALQSNHPFFSADVKAYDITEYPLVHHARKYGLNAAVAIRLRSTHTGDDDYILEFFLPINLKGSTEQQLLLNNLSGTMQRICKSLRTVADAELVGDEGSKLGCQGEAVPTPKPMSLARETAQIALPEGNFDSTDKTPFNISSSRTYDAESMGPHDQVATASRRQPEKKRSTAEKNVSLSVLQQYFSGSLKDAAKSIGVCPTTLKRICRQHGISRWPSRKINKVNRSLRKIQTVLDSVQGVEGGLKFNPITGGFVAGGSVIHDVDSFTGSTLQNGNLPVKNSYPVNRDVKSVPLAPYSDSDSFTVKLDGHGDDNCIQTSGEALRKSNISVVNWNGGSKLVGSDDGLYQQANFEYRPWSCVNTSSILTAEMDAKLEGDDAITEHNQPTCSSTTDSSNGSDSFIHSSSSSPCMKEEKHSKVKASVGDTGTKITVKATYKEDTVRFKFEPSSGCLQLYEEVGKRFNLQDGTFQLKYLDDEEEWVMLTSDSDLLECVELMECVGTRNAKLLVRDTLLTMGSSGSSNCFLAGSS